MGVQQEKPAASQSSKLPLRPVLITSEPMLRQYSSFLEHFLVGLADEAVLSALICPTDFDVTPFLSPAVEIIRYPAYNLPVFWYQNQRRLIEQLERFKPTILHCMCQSRAFFALRLARKLNIPFALTVDSLQRRFSSFSYFARRSSRIIALAGTIASNLTQTFPWAGRKVEQINMGSFVEPDSNCFKTRGRVASIVTAQTPADSSEFENLFKAIKHLAIDGYELMLIIAGCGRDEANVRRQLGSQGLLQISVLVSDIEPRHRVLSAGDIFIQPKPVKTFNPFLLDAMSIGSAVAACKGGVDDLIIENETAVVFDPDDELSIYDSLRKLFDRPERAKKLAKAAQQHLRDNYTVSKMVSSTLQTYRKAQEQFQA